MCGIGHRDELSTVFLDFVEMWIHRFSLVKASLEMTASSAGEMAQQLRALAVLPEDLGSIPSNHIAAQNCL